MKKNILSIAAVLLMTSVCLFAYNPPVSGQSLYVLSSPTQLTSASSAAGGGIFMPGPDSIAFNPALTAMEQRIQLDSNFSVLASTKEMDNSFNSAAQTGILIPLKMFVASAILNGVFCSADDMYLANTINIKAGLSKEITENLSVGMNLSGGFLFGAGADWGIGGDIGVLYRLPKLGFLKDCRLGISMLNLGKYYGYNTKVWGIIIDEDENGNYIKTIADPFPATATFRIGTAALLLKNDSFDIGMSFDIAAPSFQNVIFDAGVQFGVKDTAFLNISESIDIAEIKNGHKNFLPAVSLGVKFNFNAKNNEYLKSRSWDSSEMLVSAAWQQRYTTVQTFSGGVKVKLGQKDTTPPVIQIWNGSED